MENVMFYRISQNVFIKAENIVSAEIVERQAKWFVKYSMLNGKTFLSQPYDNEDQALDEVATFLNDSKKI